MRILITNDDGIEAPGLAVLVPAFRDVAQVAVVSPERVQTGVGHGITVGAAIRVQSIELAGAEMAWAVDGRPADCVRLAILELLDTRPDFVISGINAGLNTGLYTLYSGTVAAAAEAAVFFGIPAMAVSLECYETMDYTTAAAIARRIVDAVMAIRPQTGLCLNINIPAMQNGPPRGIRVCPRDQTTIERRFRKESAASGQSVFWFDGGDPDKIARPGTDLAAVLDGYVAVTPLTFTETDPTVMDAVSKWSWPDPLV